MDHLVHKFFYALGADVLIHVDVVPKLIQLDLYRG